MYGLGAVVKLDIDLTKVPVMTLPAKENVAANVEASRHPVYDATLALGTKNSVDAIISLFSDSSTNPFLPTWINLLLKAYAFIGIFSKHGLLNNFLRLFGIAPANILFTDFVRLSMYNLKSSKLINLFSALLSLGI